MEVSLEGGNSYENNRPKTPEDNPFKKVSGSEIPSSELRSGLNGPRNKKELLTFEEIAEGSFESLESLLKGRGIEIKSLEALITLISTEWERIKLEKLAELQSAKDEFSPEVYIVKTRESNCYIYGSIHDWGSGKKYHSKFENKIAEHENVAYEQGMGRIFSYPKGAVAIADWIISTPLELFKFTFWAGLDPRVALGGVWSWVNPTQSRSDLNNSAIPQVIQNERGGLPDHLTLELEIQNGVPMDFITKRSAFQAEFMRHWKKNEDRALHVGGMHSTEINFFLKHGVADHVICERAAKHAYNAENRPIIHKLEYYGAWTASLVYGGAGFALGAAPWIAGGYFALKEIFQYIGLRTAVENLIQRVFF
jgi:hypothetical protein